MARFPWRALGISLGLHALVLAAVAPPRMSPELAGAVPLNASLRPVDAVTRELPVPVPERARPVAEAPLRRPAPAPVAAVSPEPTLPVDLIHEAGLPETAEAGGAVAASVAASGAGQAADPAPGPVAGAVRAELAPDAAGLRKFRLAIAGEARGLRRYPEAARRAGLTGMVEVRVNVRSGGAVRHAELHRSSGHAVLDAAALDMLGLAARRADLPESLRGRDFAVLLPVAFEVEE